MKKIFYLTLLLMISCSANKPLTHSYRAVDLQQPIVSLVEVGDQVKVTTKKDGYLIFKVVNITDSSLIGDNILVPMSEIVHLEKLQVSVVKTGVWLALLAGIIHYLENNLAFFPT